MPTPRDTIAAPATALGGALAVVRLSGPRAWDVAASILDLRAPPEPRRQTRCRVLEGGAALDDALVALFPAGASYTGEECVELSLHGSRFVVERVLALCRAAGARPARPGEFTQRAYLAGRLDLAQAEAVCDLIAARSADEHRAALGQLEGGLSRRVEALRGEILELAALVEANLDHPDDDLPPVAPAEAAALARRAAQDIAALAGARRRGRGEGRPRVVLFGAPNAGKSSLLNALLGEDRALVSEEPGTTRDLVEAPVDLGGAAASLVDTAGLRDAPAGSVERLGIERARAAVRAADLALLVVDRAGAPAEAARALAEARALVEPERLTLVLSKSDLPARVGASDAVETVAVSALTGAGLPELAALARRRLAPSAALTVSERHGAALDGARAAALDAAASLESGDEVLAARHLRAALAALDSIVGRDTGDEVLAAVFSRFCVGK